jgi:flagellar biosynthesis regulator FlaF
MVEEESKGVPELNEKNYNEWVRKMKSVLIYKSLYEAIETSAAEEAALSEAKKVAFRKLDAQCLAMIRLKMSNQQATLIDDCKTSREAWQVLLEDHKSSAADHQHELRTELTNIKKGVGESYAEYCARGQTLFDDLTLADENSVTETQAAWALLEGLPPDFKEFVSTVKAVHAGANSVLPLRQVRKMILVKAKDVMKLQDSNPPMGLAAVLP